MNLPLDAGVLPCLVSVQINMNWPRFIMSLCVLAAILWYMAYSWTKR